MPYMFRKAENSDIIMLTALWEEVFLDDAEFIRGCIQSFAGIENVYVAQTKEKEIEAMMMAVPCYLNEKKGVYLYALATKKEARGKGIMSKLMDFAEKEYEKDGAVFSVLVPAEAGLIPFYEKRGYNDLIFLRYIVQDVFESSGMNNVYTQKIVSMDELYALRKKYGQTLFFTFGKESCKILDEDLKSEKVMVFEEEKSESYGVCIKHNDEILVPEIFAKDDASAQRLLGHMAKEMDAKKVHITLSQSSNIFYGQGKIHPFALAMWKNETEQNAYLRFAMEDIKVGFSQMMNS